MPPVLTAEECDRLLLAEGQQFRVVATVRATQLTVDRSWATAAGDTLHASAGHWWLTDGDDQWSVAPAVFAQVYEDLGAGIFRKRSVVTAVQLARSATIETLEGSATAEAGDWLVRNPTGESWPVPARIFQRRYVPCNTQDHNEFPH